MIFVDFIGFCSVGVGCEMEILDFCIAFFEVAMVFFCLGFLGVFDKGNDFEFLVWDVCFLLCYLGVWWVLCFLRLVCKLTTYTDIGKMGLANLFFVPPP